MADRPGQRLIRPKSEPVGERQEESFSADGKSKAELWLTEFTYNTPPEKLAEMTNIPLDQMFPLSMMSTYASEFLLLCEAIKDAQREYNKIWLEYHPDDIPVDVDNDPEYNMDKVALLMADWLYYYYQVRRSLGGDHHMGAITLAQDQIAAEMQKSPLDEFGDIKEQ